MPQIQPGRLLIPMIKVTVLYPNKPGSHFDVEYYLNTHMPMSARLLGVAVKDDLCRDRPQRSRSGRPATLCRDLRIHLRNRAGVH